MDALLSKQSPKKWKEIVIRRKKRICKQREANETRDKGIREAEHVNKPVCRFSADTERQL